ncbi:MAG: outer membrane protein assembly factor BamC [Pseudomonadota bacterium]|jgi:outer membrane protein assembly factor BamC
MTVSSRPRLTTITLACLIALSGCSTITGSSDVDYQSSKARNTPLDVPPDLLKPTADERFSVPASGVASRAAFDQGQRSGVAKPSGVLPSFSDMRFERQGDLRVLVVNKPVEQVWPVLRQFFTELGFTLVIDSEERGLLETEWAENRAKIPQDFIRRSLGRLVDGIYDTGERDKFRVRMERRPDGQSEISLTHRGLLEQETGNSDNSGTRWINRPSDPQLEQDFLRRIMLKLGAPDDKARELLQAGASQTAAAVRLANDDKRLAIDLDESFDRAWRRVGVAIDRLGFSVDDRDRAKGLLFVRYRDPSVATSAKGFFSRIFSGDEPDPAQTYQLKLTSQGEKSVLQVLDQKGQPVKDANAQKMLTVLFDRLK